LHSTRGLLHLAKLSFGETAKERLDSTYDSKSANPSDQRAGGIQGQYIHA
jgi:hypothetical protein